MNERRRTFEDLVAIMARLRAPGGCPWDRQQTHQSLAPYLLEETYEALEAIDAGAPERLREELGDLLLQVVFHAQMAAETGAFTIGDVVAGLAGKLIRRHPHVFGETRVAGPEAVLANWEAIKETERTAALEERATQRERTEETGGHAPDSDAGRAASAASALDGLPRTLPALMLAQRMQERAASVGFTWPGLRDAIGKIREELAELASAVEGGARDHVAEELGDLLFTVANLPRYLGLDGEEALRRACDKFRERFARLEGAARAEGRSLSEYSIDELLTRWRASR